MQKYLKNNKGFTLVEVIVVAVIVLVLAAVAIPLYNGYVRDSRIAVLENTAGSIASGIGAAVSTGLDVPASVANNGATGDGTGNAIRFPSRPGATDTISFTLPKQVQINVNANAVVARYNPPITGIDSVSINFRAR